MNLIKYNRHNRLYPYNTLLESFFDDNFMSKNIVPALNISENNTSYIVEMATPGYTKDDLKVDINNNILTISSEKESKNEESDDNYKRQEFYYSSFKRSVQVPENIKIEDITAQYKDGVLKLEIPKKAKEDISTKRVIDIQ